MCLLSAASALHRLMEGFSSKHPRPSLRTDTTHSRSAKSTFLERISEYETKKKPQSFLGSLTGRNQTAETRMLVRHGDSWSIASAINKPPFPQ